MTESEVARALDAYAAVKNAHDVDGILELCAPDCSYESVGLPGAVRGHDALRGFYGALFAAIPDYYGDFDGRAITGDTAVVWGRFGGKVEGEFMGLPATGRRLEVPVVFVCTFRDGLLVSDVGYFDAATMLEQAGVTGAQASGAMAEAGAHGGAESGAHAFVRRFAAAWAEPSPERLAELAHADTSNLYPFMDAAADRAGLADFFRTTLETVPDLTLKVLRWAESGRDVFIEWEASATVGDRPLVWQGADRFTLRGDRCVEGRAYYDTHALREAQAAAAEAAAA